MPNREIIFNLVSNGREVNQGRSESLQLMGRTARSALRENFLIIENQKIKARKSKSKNQKIGGDAHAKRRL